MKRALTLSASILALVYCGAGHAQTAQTTSAKTGSATASSANGGLEVVVVTAERRTTDLQRTAISATVLSGAELENKGVLTVDQLQFIAPSVTIDNFGQGNDFNIRGIGKGEHNTQTNTGVITYRDGVPTFPGYITEEPYYDIASIQVLRGPQGTFVGQNATGGAVFVTSNDPEIGGGYHGYAQAQYGNYNDASLQGAVNIPLSDTLAMRFALYGERRDTFYTITDSSPVDNCPGHKYAGCKPGYNPGDLRWGAGRISVLWKPTSALKVLVKYDADYLDNGAYPASNYYEGFKYWPYGSTTPNPHYSDIYHITANYPMMAIDRFNRAILKVDYVFPNGITLRSVSGYQDGSTDWTTDLDATDYGDYLYPSHPNNWFFSDRVDERIYSEEVNLISPDTGRVTWILGGFAQSNVYDFPYGRFTVGVPGVSEATSSVLYGKNFQPALAGFGQISVNLPKGFQVQLGARYSYSRSTNNVTWDQYGLIAVEHQHTKSYALTYKAALNWTVNDTNFLYAFVATGYKPGGLNPPIYNLVYPRPFGPEKVTSYEAGWKTTLFNRHLRATLDGYYNDYNNFMVIIGYPNLPIPGFSTELNDPNTTTTYGFEAETEAAFGPLSFSAGLGLMHSSLGTFYATDSRVPAGATACDPTSGPASASCVNLKGHPMTYAPNFTFNFGVQYRFDLANGDRLTPRLNYGHVSSQWATLFDNPALGDRITDRDLLGAQIAWTHHDWVVTLYGTNLTDQHYETALISNLRMAGAPRQVGIRLMKAF